MDNGTYCLLVMAYIFPFVCTVMLILIAASIIIKLTTKEWNKKVLFFTIAWTLICIIMYLLIKIGNLLLFL